MNIRGLSLTNAYVVNILFLFSLIYILQCLLCPFIKTRFFIPLILFISLTYSGVLLFQYNSYDLYHSFATNEIYKTLILDYKYWFNNFTAFLDSTLIGYYFLLSFIIFIGFLISLRSFFHISIYKLDKYKYLVFLGSLLFVFFATPQIKSQTAEVSFLNTLSRFLWHHDFDTQKKQARTFDKIETKEVDFNILLVVNESLRKDHLNIYGYSRETSPNISKYFKDALRYEKCFSTAAVTHVGLQSIFTGFYPSRHASKVPTLWQYASQLDLHTFYFGSQVLSWSDGLDQYILEYDFVDKIFSPITSNRAVGHDDSLTIKAFKTHIQKHDSKPFFGVVHLNATHFPYLEHNQTDRYFPTSYTTDTNKKQELINAYDNAIIDLDNSIAQVMEILKSNDLSDNTIVILLSDHAEAFGEHKAFFHTTMMYNEAIHVPLLISLPKKIQKSMDQNKLKRLKLYQDQYISNVDVMPTIMDLYDILNDQKTDGISLLQDTEREYIFSTTDINDITFTFINTLNKNKYLFDNRHYESYLTNLETDPYENNYTTIPMGRLYNRGMAMRYIKALKSKK